MSRIKIVLPVFVILAIAGTGTVLTMDSGNRSAASHIQKISLDRKTYDSIQELKDDSDLVVCGTVLDNGRTITKPPLKATDGTEVANIPTTEFKVAVTKVFKGNAPGSQITIVLTGGVAGDTRYEAEGMPWPKKQTNAIIYLHLGDDGKYYPMAGGAALALEKNDKTNTFTLPSAATGKNAIDISESEL